MTDHIFQHFDRYAEKILEATMASHRNVAGDREAPPVEFLAAHRLQTWPTFLGP